MPSTTYGSAVLSEAIADVDETAEAERTKALDSALSPDANAAREAMQAAAFARDRGAGVSDMKASRGPNHPLLQGSSYRPLRQESGWPGLHRSPLLRPRPHQWR
jgi:hypothetical protein